jgi:hypothetical protein
MHTLARLSLVAVLAFWAAPAVARPAASRVLQPPANTFQLRVPLGRQASGTQPASLHVTQLGPHKAGRAPAPAPEFNPLKRRRIAMPPIQAESEFAF